MVFAGFLPFWVPKKSVDVAPVASHWRMLIISVRLASSIVCVMGMGRQEDRKDEVKLEMEKTE